MDSDIKNIEGMNIEVMNMEGMNIEDKLRISTLKEIAPLGENSNKKIGIVLDEATGRLYVKKVLPGTEHFPFYQRLAGLKHRNLIKITDVFCGRDAIWVLEEYISGHTLQELLELEGVWTERQAARLAVQICDALHYLHSQEPPIIHRDVKPENIILSSDDVIKLFDFDIAREYKESLERDTVIMGTREYAAPEQYGFQQTDSRTDVYALGVLLHEMVTGKLPGSRVVYQGRLRKIMTKCLRLEPKQRYRNVLALKKALLRVDRNQAQILMAAGVLIVLCFALFLVSLSLIVKSLGSFAEEARQEEPGGREEQADGVSLFAATVQWGGILRLMSSPGNEVGKEGTESESQTTAGGDDVLAGTEGSTGGAAATDGGIDESAVIVSGDVDFAGMDELFPELYNTFEYIDRYGAKPTKILEHQAVTDALRSLTGHYYDRIITAFQESYEFDSAFEYDNDHFVISTFNKDADGEAHDEQLLELYREGRSFLMNVSYYDGDSETIYFFTSAEDKGRISRYCDDWAFFYSVQRDIIPEKPLIFQQPAPQDITGVYYLGDYGMMEVYEEAGEMKFAYTDLDRRRVTGEQEPVLVTTLHKLDASHYWIENYPKEYRDKLMFNFSENYLTILESVFESAASEYGLRDRNIDISIDGVYTKADN